MSLFFISWLHSFGANQRSRRGGGHLSLHQRLPSSFNFFFFFLRIQRLAKPLWCYCCFIPLPTDTGAPQGWLLGFLLLKKWSNVIIEMLSVGLGSYFCLAKAVVKEFLLGLSPLPPSCSHTSLVLLRVSSFFFFLPATVACLGVTGFYFTS